MPHARDGATQMVAFDHRNQGGERARQNHFACFERNAAPPQGIAQPSNGVGGMAECRSACASGHDLAIFF